MTHNVHSDKCATNTTITSISPSGTLKTKNRKSNYDAFFLEPYNGARGETALWIAVITQAMMDALSHSKQSEAQYHKHEAIRWLSDNSKDFVEVCMSAGLDPDYVRRKAKRALVVPTLWRAAPGKGKRYLERKSYRERMKSSATKEDSARRIHSFSYTTDIGGQIIVGPWA
jgi:hypothetical protein